MCDSFRLFDFNIPDVTEDTSSDSDNSGPNFDKRLYNIQMFGINEK